MEVYKNSRGSNRLVFNLTSFQKLYIFSIMMVMPNFMAQDLRVPLVTVTMLAYQAGYMYLKHSRYYYKFLHYLVLNTFLYFTYVRMYLP